MFNSNASLLVLMCASMFYLQSCISGDCSCGEGVVTPVESHTYLSEDGTQTLEVQRQNKLAFIRYQTVVETWTLTTSERGSGF